MQQPICCHWLRGRCTYKNCKFSHHDDGRPCRYGAACGHGHAQRAVAQPQSQLVCCHWLRGRCTHPRCKFLHKDDGQPCQYRGTCHHGHADRVGSDGQDTDSDESSESSDSNRQTQLVRRITQQMAKAAQPQRFGAPVSTPAYGFGFGGPHVPQRQTVDPRQGLVQKTPPRATALPSTSSSCAICYERGPVLRQPSCKHPPDHCEECLRQHIAIALEAKGNVVRCPSQGCTVVLHTETVVQKYATKAAFEELSERLTLQHLSSQSTFIRCSNSRCGMGFDVPDGEENPWIVCPRCNASTCFQCQRPFHRGLTCNEFRASLNTNTDAERKTQDYLKENTRRCPKCGTGPCEKSAKAECDVATCPKCVPRFRFCWQCLVDYDLIFKTDCKSHKPGCRYYA
jgi:hypothetical protein